MSFLVISEILALFVNTRTADGKYSVRNNENLRQPIQMQLSQKQETFLNFLPDSWKLHQIFNMLKGKMTDIAYVFPKLKIAKTSLEKYSLPNSENLQKPIQMQLSKRQKASSQYFAGFLKTA